MEASQGRRASGKKPRFYLRGQSNRPGQHQGDLAPARVFLGGELRLVRTVEHVVLPFMLERLKP